MSSTDIRLLAQRFFNECWNEGRLDVVNELLAPEHVHPFPYGDVRGPENIKAMIRDIRKRFPDFQITIGDEIVGSDKVVLRWTIRGTHQPTGNSVEYTGIDIIRIANVRARFLGIFLVLSFSGSQAPSLPAHLWQTTREIYHLERLMEYLQRLIIMTFDYSLNFKDIDFRTHPELYRIGRGEQGVLMVEPYKSEILPHWSFRTPDVARRSAHKIYRMFLAYKAEGDFVGMDMARKFLQMGYTRARRYANHRSGQKYAKDRKEVLPREEDPVKAESARIFQEKWKLAREDKDYLKLKKKHRELHEQDTARR